jgi:DNA repair protein RadD
MITLRPYQQAAVEAVYQHLRQRDDNPCVVLPTGTGKSLVLGQIATDAVTRWHGRVLILAHVKELLEQNAQKIQKLCPELDVGIYSAGLNRRDTDNAVIVAGIQSVYKRACDLGSFNMILVDEVHRLNPDSETMYQKFIKDAKVVNPHLRVIGLTATPYRLKGGEICKPENILNHICYEVGIKDMIVQGYLCKLKSRGGLAKANLDNLHIRGGDFMASEMEAAMDTNALVSSACHEIVELTRDRKSVLIFTAGVEHCRRVAAEIARRSGMECGAITGETPDGERTEFLARFKGEAVSDDLFGHLKPRLKYLANVNVLTTGFDAPNTDCVVLLRPTASVGLYVQMVGRGTRLYPGKEDCLILDYGGNVLRHGPVDAVTINGAKGSDSSKVAAKECSQCNALIHSAYRVCPECGYEFPPPEENQNIQDHAGHESILSGEITDTEYEVREVSYGVHTKRDADNSTPKTMRVEYRIGWNQYVSEWVCPEHTGYARAKFKKWWLARSMTPPPHTAEDAVYLANDGALAETKSITVRTVSGEKYDHVIGFEIGPIPEYHMDAGWSDSEEKPSEYATVTSENNWLNDDEIPF